MIAGLKRTMHMLDGVGSPGVTAYVLAGAAMGIAGSLYSMFSAVYGYITHTYPLNWMALPFDFLKSKEWILVIGMLSSSIITIISCAAIGGVIGIGVKLIFGRGKASFAIQPSFASSKKIEAVAAAACAYSLVVYCGAYMLLGLFLVISSPGVEKAAGDAREAPNVILITVDALRPDHLSCYGYPLPTSPRIDALAAESSRFTNAISVSPYTLGAVPCMMTSLYPGQIGMGEEEILALAHRNTTLAELLQREGYETAAFVGNYFLRKEFNLWQGFYIYDDAFSSRELQRGFPEEAAGQLTAKAIDWLRSAQGRKYFLWLHYQDPHGPYTPPSPFDRAFNRSQYPPRSPVPLLEDNSGYGGIPRYQIVNGEQDPNYYLSQYDGEINYVDHHIGVLLAELKKLGQYDTTAIIIAADHGEAMAGEGGYYFCHGETVREEIIKIPLIIKRPGVNEGSSISTQVSSLDITPTILEAAHIHVIDAIQGESLMGLMEGGHYRRTYAYSHKASMDRPSRAIRTNEYKLMMSGDTLEFYDLTADPAEGENVYDRGDMQEVAKLFKRELDEHIRQLQASSPLYQNTVVDERTKTMLKALGYID